MPLKASNTAVCTIAPSRGLAELAVLVAMSVSMKIWFQSRTGLDSRARASLDPITHNASAVNVAKRRRFRKGAVIISGVRLFSLQLHIVYPPFCGFGVELRGPTNGNSDSTK